MQVTSFFSQPIPETIQVNAARGRIKEPAQSADWTTEPVFRHGLFFFVTGQRLWKIAQSLTIVLTITIMRLCHFAAVAQVRVDVL